MIKWIAVSAGVWVLDQLTKYWVVTQMVYREEIPIAPFFTLVRWHNDGAAFSFLAGAGGWQHWFFVSLATGFSVYLLYELKRLKEEEKHLGWVFALILGGALGNLADRLNHGHVIDFLFFHWGAQLDGCYPFQCLCLKFGSAFFTKKATATCIPAFETSCSCLGPATEWR